LILAGFLGRLFALFLASLANGRQNGGQPVMTRRVTYRKRLGEREGAVRQLAFWRDELRAEFSEEFWKKEHDLAQLVLDIQDSIQEQIKDQDDDTRFLQAVVESVRGGTAQQIDEATRFLQEYLGSTLRVLDYLEEGARLVTQCGYEVENAAELGKLRAVYALWKDGLPERLAMEYGPVKEVLKERIRASFANPPQESDWRQYFPGENKD